MGKNIKENFDIILSEMFGSENMCFDTLLEATRKDVVVKARYWCNRYGINYSEAYEDVTQIVLIRVFKTCVPQFFCKNGFENLNTSADEYWFWVQKICRRCACTLAKKMRNGKFEELSDEERTQQVGMDVVEEEPDTEKLCEAFNTIMNAGGNVYKPLTWLTHSLIVLINNETRIEANEDMIKYFSDMTLDEMFSFVLRSAERFPWLKFSEESIANVEKGLDKIHESGRRMGEVTYSECFMAKGPKASISDWINRMDSKITSK